MINSESTFLFQSLCPWPFAFVSCLSVANSRDKSYVGRVAPVKLRCTSKGNKKYNIKYNIKYNLDHMINNNIKRNIKRIVQRLQFVTMNASICHCEWNLKSKISQAFIVANCNLCGICSVRRTLSNFLIFPLMVVLSAITATFLAAECPNP